mgnify:CR=1 FL=1
MKPSVGTVLKCYGQQYLNRYGCTMRKPWTFQTKRPPFQDG